jgi:hypothetical protein
MTECKEGLVLVLAFGPGSRLPCRQPVGPYLVPRSSNLGFPATQPLNPHVTQFDGPRQRRGWRWVGEADSEIDVQANARNVYP